MIEGKEEAPKEELTQERGELLTQTMIMKEDEAKPTGRRGSVEPLHNTEAGALMSVFRKRDAFSADKAWSAQMFLLDSAMLRWNFIRSAAAVDETDPGYAQFAGTRKEVLLSSLALVERTSATELEVSFASPTAYDASPLLVQWMQLQFATPGMSEEWLVALSRVIVTPQGFSKPSKSQSKPKAVVERVREQVALEPVLKTPMVAVLQKTNRSSMLATYVNHMVYLDNGQLRQTRETVMTRIN